jgi:hypothetical protein
LAPHTDDAGKTETLIVLTLGPQFRCITFDLPLGSHTLPMPDAADVSPLGLAGCNRAS